MTQPFTHLAALSIALLAGAAGPALAQNAPLVNPVAPAQPPPAAGPLSLDGVLDMLDTSGQNLKSFTADVTLTEEDLGLALESTRLGKVWYQKLDGGDARFRVSFTDRQDKKTTRKEPKDYVLDKGVLTDRDHDKKIEVRRQVVKPGQKMDLLRLGEGPFPLPIGQKKEEVKKQFEASLVPAVKDDPPGTVHLLLKPIKGTRFARDFGSLDVFVDPRTRMPVRIDTLDPKGEKSKTTVLKNLAINPQLRDGDFQLPPARGEGWNVREEAFNE